MVVKPAPKTPLTALLLAEVLVESRRAARADEFRHLPNDTPAHLVAIAA